MRLSSRDTPSSSATADETELPARCSAVSVRLSAAVSAVSAVSVRLSVPAVFGVGARVHLLAAGDKHVVAVLRAGNCFAWGAVPPAYCIHFSVPGVATTHWWMLRAGDGALGQLGHGSREHVAEPRRLLVSEVPGTRVLAVAVGSVHTLLVGSDDVVYACGHGLYGQVSATHTGL
jgi:alpha-tubulin suppressor-like RCC1 family protein